MQYRIALALAAMMIAGPAIAQTPQAAPASKPHPVAAPAPAKTTKPANAPVVRTAKSMDCSKQADAKALHGKPRKMFMSSCKKA